MLLESFWSWNSIYVESNISSLSWLNIYLHKARIKQHAVHSTRLKRHRNKYWKYLEEDIWQCICQCKEHQVWLVCWIVSHSLVRQTKSSNKWNIGCFIALQNDWKQFLLSIVNRTVYNQHENLKHVHTHMILFMT